MGLWTLPREEARARPSSPLQSRPALDDIEGTRTALARFRPGNQRIVADPYPDRHSAPRAAGAASSTESVEGGAFRAPSSSAASAATPQRRALPHPYAQHEGANAAPSILVASRVVFDRRTSRYVTRDSTLPAAAGDSPVALSTPARPRLVTPSVSHARLDASDIAGATPRSRTGAAVAARAASAAGDGSRQPSCRPPSSTPGWWWSTS